ncbi:exosortase/archaeosortase family protein, partial [Thermodesulfobacteriota bacterium]
MNSTNQTYLRLAIFIGLSSFFGIVFYREAITEIFLIVINREGSSHGLFVPFLSLYFLWVNFDILNKLEPKTDRLGVLIIIIGIIFPILNIGSFHIKILSYIAIVSGLAFTTFGKEIFRHLAFPIVFLITMIPIPDSIYEALANYSRNIAFGGSLKIISLLGIPYFKDGWVIQLQNALLHVAISCSGIRYLITYFVFGLAYAYITRSNYLYRFGVLILTIPISHIASIVRLSVIFVMTHLFGPYWAQHKPHIFLSWSVFTGILFASIALDQFLQKKLQTNRVENMIQGSIKIDQ